MKKLALLTALLTVFCTAALARDEAKKIPAHSKVYIAPIEGGFENDLKAALEKKNVPLDIVTDRGSADFELTGTAESQKAGKAKKIIMLDWHSNEQASIKLSDLKSGEVVFAYSVNKQSSAHGKRSTAEACAKHLKERVEEPRPPEQR